MFKNSEFWLLAPTPMKFAPAKSVAGFVLSWALASACAQDNQSTVRVASPFEVAEYRVEGNSLLDDVEIETVLQPFLGPGGTINRIETARAALEGAYHQRGWLSVAVRIPEQRVDEGEVVLRVIEAPLERVVVRGALFFAPDLIKSLVPELSEQKVPNFPRVQSELSALNSSEDLRVTPILRAGSKPDTIDAVLDVDDNLPVHGTVEVNNRQAPNTSPTRIAASLRIENLFQSRHSASLLLQAAPEQQDQIRVAAINYGIPMGSPGQSLGIGLVSSRSRLARLNSAPGLGLLGNADILSARWVQPLASMDGISQSISLSADYRSLGQVILVDGEPGVSTPLRYLPFSVAYNVRTLEDPSPIVFEATSTFALRGLVGSDEAFNARRAGTNSNFNSLRLGLGASQRLGRWEASGRFDLQWSAQPLIGNEQFLVGGSQSVRGYLEGEAGGDEGQRVSFELRSPSQPLSGWRWLGLGFVEGAQTRTLASGTAPGSVRRLSGTGFGLRLNAPKRWSVEFDAAQSLRDAAVTHAGDVRVHLRLIYSE